MDLALGWVHNGGSFSAQLMKVQIRVQKRKPVNWFIVDFQISGPLMLKVKADIGTLRFLTAYSCTTWSLSREMYR